MLAVLDSETDFIPVSLSTISEGLPQGLELYLRDGETGKMKLYNSSDLQPSQKDLDRLARRGVKRMYIPRHENFKYQEYLREILAQGDNPNLDSKVRIGALNEVVRDVLRESFDGENTDATVDNAQNLAKMSAEIICDEKFVATDLFNVLHHDYTTFTHSANVAYYCTMLAKGLSFNRETVEEISAGALVHDLGKLQIPEKILCKPGKLTDWEFRCIRRHPLDGFRMLAHREELSYGQLMMVYQHHERLDGRGYPTGCVESELHPWAKLCTVADVFDALTSVRPYRKPMPFSAAIELMERDKGKAFDPEMLECWKWITENVSKQ